MAWLRRWWWLGIPVVPIVLALLTGISIRLMGEADLAAVRREIAASGQPVDYATWRATIPPADAERGEALRKMLRQFGELDILSKERALEQAMLPPWEPKTTTATAAAKRLATAATRAAAHAQRIASASADLDAVVARSRSLLVELKPLLTAGPAVPLTATWLLPEDPSMAQAWFLRPDTTTNLLENRNAITALAYSASAAVDPSEDLDSMRALIRCALAGPGLIDHMVGIALLDISDRTHMRLMRLDRLAPGAGERWMADLPDVMELTRGGLVSERISGTIWGAGSFAMDLLAPKPDPSWLDPWHRCRAWMDQPRLQADWEMGMHRLSTTTAILPHGRITAGWSDGPPHTGVLNLQESMVTAFIADAEARIYRAAALILLHADREPDATVEARIRPLLDGEPGRVQLGWERLPDRRVRVGVDPRMGQPVALDRFQRLTSRGLGTPPNPTANPGRISSGTLEFDLP